jgi:alpha-galactosidase
MLCQWLDVPVDECDVMTAGINHMAWFLTFKHKGVDLCPRLWEKLDREGPIKGEEYRFEMMKAAGFFMTESPGHLSEYLPYFRKRKDLLQLFNGPGFSGETSYYLNSNLRHRASWMEEMREWADGKKPTMFQKGHKSVEYASNIMNSKLTGNITRFAGNVLNKGFITNLPYDSCVEVPVFTDRLGLHGSYVGRIPEQCAALCQSNISAQELTVKAALEGNLEAVYHACMLDPLTAAVLAPHEIRNMVDEMIEAQRPWLPQFAGKKPTSPGHRVGRLETGATSLVSGAEVKEKKGHYD